MQDGQSRPNSENQIDTHTDHAKSNFCFFANALKKGKKEKAIAHFSTFFFAEKGKKKRAKIFAPHLSNIISFPNLFFDFSINSITLKIK